MGRLKNKIFAKLFTKFPRLLDRAAGKIEPAAGAACEGIPWAPFSKPLKASVVAIVTTAGLHLKGQQPFDMSDPDGDPWFRELPSDTPSGGYKITHDYYDHTDADKDLNIVFPIERLKEMERAGAIKAVARLNYGFMGHITGRHVDTLVKKSAPEVAARLKKENADAVLLTPG